MHNAAASFDDAFDFDEPARKKAPRKPRAAPKKGPSGKKAKKGKRFRFDMHKVSRYAAIGMSATVALAIMVNALVMQKGHHPAPLFGKAIALGPILPAGPARETAKVATTPTPAPAHALEDTSGTDAPAPATNAEPRRVANEKAPGDDPIARLLQGGSPTSASTDKSGEARTVLGAQRALVKLGFVLKPNGTLGPQTRKAIELFEKDRHLPVKGELTRRVVKILAAESGLKID